MCSMVGHEIVLSLKSRVTSFQTVGPNNHSTCRSNTVIETVVKARLDGSLTGVAETYCHRPHSLLRVRGKLGPERCRNQLDGAVVRVVLDAGRGVRAGLGDRGDLRQALGHKRGLNLA